MIGLPPPTGSKNWQQWGERLNAYLGRQWNKLSVRRGDEIPSDDGILMWDRGNGYPVVSKNGQFRQVLLEDGDANLGVTTTQTVAAINTAYALTFAGTADDGITLNGTRVEFTEAGKYLASFSAQISSSSSSTVNFYFWPRVNGTDLTGSTMMNSLHSNGSTLVVSRAAILTVNAGDYLEAMWAADSTSGSLVAHSATAFCPATPAATMAITRISG